jgi:hypothetical protein
MDRPPGESWRDVWRSRRPEFVLLAAAVVVAVVMVVDAARG